MNQPPDQGSPQYAAYYRGNAIYGSSDRLQALADGYYGLNWVFLVNVVLVLPFNILVRSQTIVLDFSTGTGLAIFGGFVSALLVIVALLTYPCNKKIAYGKNWAPANAIVASVLIGLNSALCCGVIGYVVMQQLAMSEMKKYGLKSARKADVQAAIANLKALESTSTQDVAPPPPQNPYPRP